MFENFVIVLIVIIIIIIIIIITIITITIIYFILTSRTKVKRIFPIVTLLMTSPHWVCKNIYFVAWSAGFPDFTHLKENGRQKCEFFKLV